MSWPRFVSLAFAISFAAVGALFVAFPGGVFAFFETAGRAAGMGGMPAGDANPGLFRILAGAYMYVVAFLAWMSFRRAVDPVWPTLLAHAKLASSLLSFVLLLLHGGFLVYLVNGIVDGLIGLVALLLRREAIRRRIAHVLRSA